ALETRLQTRRLSEHCADRCFVLLSVSGEISVPFESDFANDLLNGLSCPLPGRNLLPYVVDKRALCLQSLDSPWIAVSRDDCSDFPRGQLDSGDGKIAANAAKPGGCAAPWGLRVD